MKERRQRPDRRAFPTRQHHGRRIDDALPDPAVIVPDRIKIHLEQLAEAASKQGRERVYAICCVALARVEELETEIAVMRAKRQASGFARSEAITAKRRQEIGANAVKARWDRRHTS